MRAQRSRFTSVATRLVQCAPIALFALLLNLAAPVKVLADGGGWGGGDGGLWRLGARRRRAGGLWSVRLGAGVGLRTDHRPSTRIPVMPSQQCEITVGGTATLGQLGQFNLQANLTVDLPDGTTNGFGGQCYPATGSLSLTGVHGPAATLVVDLQGVACAVGSSTTLSAIAATYVVDATNSSGRFAGATGTGTVGAATDASQSPPTVEFAFSGSLLGASQFGGNH